MKKILSLVLITLMGAATLVSCEPETNPDNDNNQQIVIGPDIILHGKWKLEGLFFQSVDEEEGELWEHNHGCPEQPDYMEFKSNGNLINVENSDCVTGTTESNPYTFDGSIIYVTLYTDGQPHTQHIKLVRVTETELVLYDLDLDPNAEMKIVFSRLD